MEIKEIMSHVDHTMLKAFSTGADIEKICEEYLEYHMASVCIPPSYIEFVNKKYGGKINICTVIGFPLGYCTTETKVFEAADAVAKGASEIDMVLNIGWVKDGRFDDVTKEIARVKKAVGSNVLKVIVETCYLSKEEKEAVCRCVTDSGADFIKTSTGFGTAGATFDDIRLFSANIGEGIKMKAAGGIKSSSDFEEFLELGCERLGTSSAVKILVDNAHSSSY
ncbi:MAG: deoxyribose-phosphate aldolase [Oscillospiraceae bacterium]